MAVAFVLPPSAFLPDMPTLRDPLWNNIRVDGPYLALVDSAPFQRLRYVRQLGLAHLVYPGATHSRFEHVLGAYHLARLTLRVLDDAGELAQVPELDRRPVIQLGKRLREYQIPAYLVVTEHEAAVREIFRRANDTGRRMEEHEVFNAIHSQSDMPAPANVRDVAASLARLQFGGPDEATLLQMLQAIRGVDATKERAPQLGPDAHEKMVELQRSAEATIAFLRRDANIPHASLLPYQQPLLALARLFARFPEPQARSRELLARWLWRGALTGAHTGATVRTREMIAAIQNDEAAAVTALLQTLPPRPSEPPDLDDAFKWQAARSKVQVLALLDLGPRDLATGAYVITPQVLTDPVGEGQHEETAWLRMVRKIIDRPHSGLDNQMLHAATRRGLVHAIIDCEDRVRLTSHGISDAARHALRFGREDEFLALRTKSLRALVQEFTERRAEWDELDSPAVDVALEDG